MKTHFSATGTGAATMKTSRRRISGFDQLSEQLDDWRSYLNQHRHPVLLFDGNLWPVLRNRHSENEGGQPDSRIWQTACETAGRITAEHARTMKTQIADSFSIDLRSFVAVGSLLLTSANRVAGAIVNLAELQLGNARYPGSVSDGAVGRCSETDTDFQQWLTRRQDARKSVAILSSRESQVATLVASGMSSKCIARELGVGVKTIEKHRANAILKLGVANTAELVRIIAFADHEVDVDKTAAKHTEKKTVTATDRVPAL